jgi:hypothetical protein
MFFPHSTISLLSNSVVGRVVAYPFIALFITILSEVEDQSVSCCACQSEMQSLLEKMSLCCSYCQDSFKIHNAQTNKGRNQL